MNSSLRATLGWAGVFVFVATVMMLVAVPRHYAKPTARQVRERLLREIQPVVLQNCTLERIGSVYDGGYLMCGNLLGGVQSAYSYGIGPADDWGCAISQRHGVAVHQYRLFQPAAGRVRRRQDGIPRRVHRSEAGSDRVAGVRHLERIRFSTNGDARKTLVVKMDVEGAELESLLATSDRVLDRMDQLAMEIHGTDERFLALVRKLKRTFHLVHLHYNNQACSPRYRPLPAWAYQVLLVNKRIGVRDPTRPAPTLPHPLDAPDYSLGRDCQVLESPR